MTRHDDYVDHFRASAPYINAHRGSVVVVHFGGEAVEDAGFPEIVHDIALLHSLGMQVVLVHGMRPQVERRLEARGIEMRYEQGLRITDLRALEVVKEAAGSVRIDIESLLSMGLANSPMAGASIRVSSGNFVTARPIGVRDGVDFEHTGQVRRVDSASVRRLLDDGRIVIVSPLGYSPTAEVFNLSAEEVATETAVAIGAAKLVILAERQGGEGAILPRELSLAEARTMLAGSDGGGARDDPLWHWLGLATSACSRGVRRVHVLDRDVRGALLLELFTRDGVGAMVSADLYHARPRRAGIDDVRGILELIAPLEADGTLVRRSRERLEMEIGNFLVVERDGTVIGCAAVFPFEQEGLAELACLAVHDDYRDGGCGDVLLERVEREARSAGARALFVLTTRASHWFRERGFEPATLDDLPIKRRELYNYRRNSKVLMRAIAGTAATAAKRAG